MHNMDMDMDMDVDMVHAERSNPSLELWLGRPCVVIDIGRLADAPDEHGVPGQHRGAPRGDGDEAGEDAVTQCTEVPDVIKLLGGDHGDHSAKCGGDCGADGGARGGGGVARGGDGEGRARVEAVPWGGVGGLQG